MSDFKNILFINFGGIGDEILFLPTIFSVKEKFPNSKITLCLEPRSKGIKDLCPLIDEVFPIDVKNGNKYKNFFSLVKYMRKGKFDLVISSGANKFIPVLLFFSGIKKRIGYNSGALSKLLLTDPISLNKNQYAGNMYHDLVKKLTGFEPKLPKIEVKAASDWLGVERFKEENSVLIHPGVSKMSVQKGMVKIFGAQKWIEIIEALLQHQKRVFLAGGPDDDVIISEILNGISPNLKSRLINYYGKTSSLYDLAQLISKMEVMICSDSAPMHIGVAVGTKTVAIFGPTDEKKLIPLNNPNYIAVTANCDCRPCLWDKRQTTCEHLYCLNFDTENIIKYCV